MVSSCVVAGAIVSAFGSLVCWPAGRTDGGSLLCTIRRCVGWDGGTNLCIVVASIRSYSSSSSSGMWCNCTSCFVFVCHMTSIQTSSSSPSCKQLNVLKLVASTQLNLIQLKPNQTWENLKFGYMLAKFGRGKGIILSHYYYYDCCCCYYYCNIVALSLSPFKFICGFLYLKLISLKGTRLQWKP